MTPSAQLCRQFFTHFTLHLSSPNLTNLPTSRLWGNHVKGLDKVNATINQYNIQCPPVVHAGCFLIVEGNKVGQAQLALGKSLLAAPSHFLVLHVLGNSFQEDVLSSLPRDLAEADTSS